MLTGERGLAVAVGNTGSSASESGRRATRDVATGCPPQRPVLPQSALHIRRWRTSGTLLSSGSITGTTRGTTVQPATADTLVIGLEQPAGKEPCGISQTDSFSLGSHISVTVKLSEQANVYHFGCFDNFSMMS